MKYSSNGSTILFLACLFFPVTSYAQNVQSLAEYLSSVNKGYVSFDGEISYDRQEDKLTVKLDEGWFGAVMDAGREMREKVQKSCASESSFDMKWCKISGQGTVEIRGSNIWISIEKILKIE